MGLTGTRKVTAPYRICRVRCRICRVVVVVVVVVGRMPVVGADLINPTLFHTSPLSSTVCIAYEIHAQSPNTAISCHFRLTRDRSSAEGLLLVPRDQSRES